MSKNIMKKVICGVLATTSLAGCVAMATACETNTPEVTLTISFNGETYELDYKLDRRVAPRTVKHFLWLAENNYYDGLCVHDYADDKMYTGGYTYTEAGDLEAKDYYAFVEGKVAEKKDFPVSVWAEKEGEEALYTLAGEFKDANFVVSSGYTRQSYGSLTMYYTAKTTDEQVGVEYLSKGDGSRAWREYKYNSATSLFYISLTNTSADSAYCTFATLEDSSKETLEGLEDALEAYIDENYGDEGDSFTASKTETVNEDDPIENKKSTVTYDVPKSPIVIESIVVKKY